MGELGIYFCFANIHKDFYEAIQYRKRNLFPTPEDQADKICPRTCPHWGKNRRSTKCSWGYVKVKQLGLCKGEAFLGLVTTGFSYV